MKIPLSNRHSCPVPFCVGIVWGACCISVIGRAKRISLGGYVYHVLNRANGRLRREIYRELK